MAAARFVLMAAVVWTAAALTMPTTTAPTTTYVEVFEENIAVNNNVFDNMAGSIVGVDTSNQTTIAINCVQSLLANCSFSSYVLPITVTKGPSTFALSLSSTTKRSADYTIFVQSQECDIISSTESASCMVYTSWWYSNSSTSTSMSKTNTVALSPAQITYDTLMVTAGIEKLLAPATTTQVESETASSTSTGVLSTTTAASSSSSSPGSHSSKAWIAGPVVGAVAGCALVAGAVYWCLRRKRRDSMVSGGVGIHDPSEEISPYVSPSQYQYKGYIPAETQGTPVAELPAHDSSWPRELSA